MNDLVTQVTSFLESSKGFLPFVNILITPGWWQLILCFVACSFLMIFRLNAVEKNGFEGTLVGTLIMPYFSGFPNLCFAYLLAKNSSNGAVVLENCLVNNVTNLTIILALPSILWGLNILNSKEKPDSSIKINHLSLLLSILAMVFFTISLYLVSKDGKINSSDGMLLVGLFIFWQTFHVFDVLKNNTRKNQNIKKRIVLDFIIIGLCAWGIFSSIENLIAWISSNGQGFFSKTNLGFLSGILMVFPNTFLALYYSIVQRSEIAYSSQIGDCHICIPLCIGVFAIFSPISIPSSFDLAIFIIIGAAVGHFIFTAFWGKLPRFAGVILTFLYALFIYKEII
ncbi:MAG: sodium:calcium symporter [Desulfobacteraceae bacterium]|nr:sodium:calcium symporter [Desulfobacteraceae bacterium]